ncbi:MAG: hypothetical protein PVH92_11285 [Anaerolineales bacterium]|jgi:hypothetical protein
MRKFIPLLLLAFLLACCTTTSPALNTEQAAALPPAWTPTPVAIRSVINQEGGTAGVTDELSFRIEFTDWAEPNVIVFDLGLTASQDSQVYLLDTGTTFENAVSFLTDGHDGRVLSKVETTSGGGSSSRMESAFFSAKPGPVSDHPDFSDFEIRAVELSIDRVVIDSPGKDPNSDGIWTDYGVYGDLIVYADIPARIQEETSDTPTQVAYLPGTASPVPPTYYYTPPPTQFQPTSTPAGTPTATPVPGPEDYEIYGLHMLDDQYGWATFAFEGVRYAKHSWFARTTDGGSTWINVTPPSYEALRVDPRYRNAWGYLRFTVLDADNALVFPSCSPTWGECDLPEVFWRTNDGGLSWETLTPPRSCLAWRVDCSTSSIQFVDEQHGWFLMLRSGRNYAGYEFYRTTDGGQSYEKLPLPPPENAVDTSLVNIPLFINEYYGLQPATGIVREPIEDIPSRRHPRMKVTSNGGLSWQTVYLPAPEGLLETIKAQPENETRFVSYQSNFIQSPEHPDTLMMLTRWEPRRDSALFSSYYFSLDRGQTWSALTKQGDSFFLDAETGWRVADMDPPTLEQTRDGGITWQSFPAESWETDLDQERSYIIHITDGGENRTEIETRFYDDRLWSGQVLRLESIHMKNDNNGCAVEVGGSAICTEDGGFSWWTFPPSVMQQVNSEDALPPTEGNWSPEEPLPQELFHGESPPPTFQRAAQRSRLFLSELDEFYSPYSYHCDSRDADQLVDGVVGVSRECRIYYPTDLHPDFGWHFNYWIYYYYALVRDGDTEIFPNVVSMDFLDDQFGWRLLDLQSGLFRLEKTENGGTTWNEVKTVAWLGEIDFVSEIEGWALALEPPQRAVPNFYYLEDKFRPVALLRTTDGGQTWQEIEPVIRD